MSKYWKTLETLSALESEMVENEPCAETSDEISAAFDVIRRNYEAQNEAPEDVV